MKLDDMIQVTLATIALALATEPRIYELIDEWPNGNKHVIKVTSCGMEVVTYQMKECYSDILSALQSNCQVT